MKLTPDHGLVIVTGAGSGLGRALAENLTARGYKVAGFGRRSQALGETAQACHGRFISVTCDVSDPDQVDRAVDDLAQHGPVSLLINNAAIYPHRDFLDETPHSFAATLNVNLGGVVNCSHAVLRHMVNTGTGRILNVATFADINPLPTAAAYSVSKGSARILTRALVADLGDRFPRICIGDWMPGMLQTSMGIPDGIRPEQAADWGVTLALHCDPSLNGSIFEMDREILPPRGLKAKIRDLVLMRRRRPRVISDL